MKETILPSKDLLMSLLRDHLLTYRLVQGLQRIGLDPIHFDIRLGETIFTLMGFGSSDKEERLFEKFLNWSEKVLAIDIELNDQHELDKLCKRIYKKLEQVQKQRKVEKHNK